MTHTLHRRGTRQELCQDFVLLSMSAKTVNAKGSGPKMRRIFEALAKHPHVNFGDCKTGSKFNNDYETIRDKFQDTSVFTCCFTGAEALEGFLAEVKSLDLGIPVVVSGLVDEVQAICQRVGLKIHTVEYSGGIHGNTALLPAEPVLEITTMCGHAQTSPELVEEMVRQVKMGKKTLVEAAEQLAQPCICGIFNPERAARILERLVA